MSCAGRPSYKPEEARGKALNLRARRPCGGRVNRGGWLRAVAQGVFQAMRQQAMRGSRLRPPGLCLPPAHPRHRGTRTNAGHRAPAGHAPMRTGGGRPGGAGGISRPILGLAEIPRRRRRRRRRRRPRGHHHHWQRHSPRLERGGTPDCGSAMRDNNARPKGRSKRCALALAGASGSPGGRPQAVAATLGPKGPTKSTNLRPACA